MTHPENINLFNYRVAVLFGALYQAFPNPIHIGPRFNDIFHSSTSTPDATTDEARAVILWLSEKGYVRTNGFAASTAQAVVLTQRGLAVLNATPAVFDAETEEPLGERIKSAVATGAKTLAVKAVELALDAGIKQLKDSAS
ncbi:MAG TPA: hypothetical protein VJ577_03490 [Burkholderiaceae bacterium]|nr:hypothetical protein [Burkholderiaceae bacterium]